MATPTRTLTTSPIEGQSDAVVGAPLSEIPSNRVGGFLDKRKARGPVRWDFRKNVGGRDNMSKPIEFLYPADNHILFALSDEECRRLIPNLEPVSFSPGNIVYEHWRPTGIHVFSDQLRGFVAIHKDGSTAKSPATISPSF